MGKTDANERSVGALRAGARGYLTKDASAGDIRSAILTVAAGEAERTPSGEPALPDELTPREAEVLRLIAQGLTNNEIAQHLVVSPTTVKSHINHLFTKAGIRDRAQAINYAYRTGIASPPG
jgi:DNA-binding NarL/FixJ family response regulator